MALHAPRFAGNARLQRASENNPALGVFSPDHDAVRLLQQALIDLGFAMPRSTRRNGGPDGIYGQETAACVRQFQQRHALSVDGTAGRQTLGRLDQLFSGTGPVVDRRRVRLHFRSIGIPRVPEMQALASAQQVYRPHDIEIEFASGQSLLLSQEDALALNVIDGQCLWDQANDEQQLLFGLGGRQGVGPNDVLVYYVERIRRTDNSLLNGCAGHEPNAPAVVVSSSSTRWTLAHELGHVLLGSSFVPVHSTDSTNLMFGSTAGITAALPALTSAQVTQMRRSRCCARA